MIITHKINIDLKKQIWLDPIHAVQSDEYSRDLEISLTEGCIPWEIPEDTQTTVWFSKPDGTGGAYDSLPDAAATAACTYEGNVLTVKLAPQVLTVPGIVRVAVRMSYNNALLHTFPVQINVIQNPGIQVTSKSYFKIAGALANSGWTPNMFLGTDDNGNVIVKEGSSGGSVSIDKFIGDLPRFQKFDFSKWADGIWSCTIDGLDFQGSVTFDYLSRPIQMSDGTNSLEITWEE